jgi:hypothetical protein
MSRRTEAYQQLFRSIDQILSQLDVQPRSYEANTLSIELELLRLELERREQGKKWWESAE